MAHLKNLVTGAVTEKLDPESQIYRTLIKQAQEGGRPKWEEVSITDFSAVLTRALVAQVPALGVAIDETVSLTGGAEKGGEVTSAEYTPTAEIVGAETNNRTLTIVDSSSSTTLCTLAFTSAAVKAAAGAPKAFTVNNKSVIASHGIDVSSAHAGTGIADPGGVITVEITYAA